MPCLVFAVQELEEAFRELDKDGSGYIDFPEYLTLGQPGWTGTSRLRNRRHAETGLPAPGKRKRWRVWRNVLIYIYMVPPSWWLQQTSFTAPRLGIPCLCVFLCLLRDFEGYWGSLIWEAWRDVKRDWRDVSFGETGQSTAKY